MPSFRATWMLLAILVLIGSSRGTTTTTPTTTTRIPQQVHLSLGDTYSQMHVLWATCHNVTSWVTYGRDREPQDMRQNGTMTYLSENSEEACRFIHRAVLRDLEEGTKYRYQVHSGESTSSSTNSSPIFSFTTLSTHSAEPLSFLMYGDLGIEGRDTFPALQREILSHNHTAVWHVGDMAYDLFHQGGWVGDEFLRQIEPVAANVPYMVAPGNHEIEADDFHHYKTRFSTPGVSWPIPTAQMWYSYDIGLVHFISYSTEVFFTSHNTYECVQFFWLLQDLLKANDNRHNVPWVVAMGHRPMYCSNSNGDDCTGLPFLGRVRAGLEDLFHAQGVDLIVEAHEHSYERTWPMYDHDVIQTNYVNPRGAVHVISGAAGNKEGTDFMKTYTKPWSAYRHTRRLDNNFGRLHIVNHTHLLWQQVRVSDAEVFDQFWLVQHSHGPFVSGDVRCQTDNPHPSCSCPLPFYVWIILAVLGLIVGIIGVSVTVKFLWVKRKIISRCCLSARRVCCCRRRGKHHPRSPTRIGRRQYRQQGRLQQHPVREYPGTEQVWFGEDEDDLRSVLLSAYSDTAESENLVCLSSGENPMD